MPILQSILEIPLSYCEYTKSYSQMKRFYVDDINYLNGELSLDKKEKFVIILPV